MDIKAKLIALLASTTEPRWTVSAIARASGVPRHSVRRFVKEPDAGLSREYMERLDKFARKVKP